MTSLCGFSAMPSRSAIDLGTRLCRLAASAAWSRVFLYGQVSSAMTVLARRAPLLFAIGESPARSAACSHVIRSSSAISASHSVLAKGAIPETDRKISVVDAKALVVAAVLEAVAFSVHL